MATMRGARARQQLQAGYGCSFVEDLPSDLIQSECSICLHVLREPYIVSCCGYRFCHGCIEPIQKQTRRCPLCNNTFDTLPDKFLERVLKDKLVYCSESAGCQWKGKLVDFEDHVKDCDWQEVTCPNNCGEKPPRKNVSKHVEESCLLTVIDCFYKPAGCDVRLTRKEMIKHSDDNLAEHLTISMLKIVKLRDENFNLKEQLDNDLGMSMSEIAELRDKNSRLEEQLESIQPTGSHPSEYLCVMNLPDDVNESMLKSIFGQFGSVRSVVLSDDEDLATIEYFQENDAEKALSCSKTRGINLKKCRLCLSPVYNS